MRKYELDKFPKLAVILTLSSLFLAVVAMSVSLLMPSYNENLGGLAIFVIVASVLVLAGLTTGRVILLKIINTILTVGLLVTSFVLAIAKFSDRDVILFAISLLMLVASILELIYFLTMKNPRINQMYFYTGICFTALVAAYGIAYIALDLFEVFQYNMEPHISNYFLLVSTATVSILPVVNHRSLKVVEENDEKPQEEVKEDNQ